MANYQILLIALFSIVILGGIAYGVYSLVSYRTNLRLVKRELDNASEEELENIVQISGRLIRMHGDVLSKKELNYQTLRYDLAKKKMLQKREANK